MIARWPLFVVTLGAERRSTPFFWLSARITTWNCGLGKTPANPNIDGATPTACPRPGTKSASSALALIAKSPLRFPDVTGFCPIGQNPVTSGNRSGDFAISANALDALLVPGLGQAVGVAPSMLGLAGVFPNPQFQVVIRALNQKKGVDLLSAPSVTTDRKSTRLNSSHVSESRMPSSA